MKRKLLASTLGVGGTFLHVFGGTFSVLPSPSNTKQTTSPPPLKVETPSLGSFARVFGSALPTPVVSKLPPLEPCAPSHVSKSSNSSFSAVFGGNSSQTTPAPPVVSKLPSLEPSTPSHVSKSSSSTFSAVFSGLTSPTTPAPPLLSSLQFPTSTAQACSTSNSGTHNTLDYRTSTLPLYITLGIPIPRVNRPTPADTRFKRKVKKRKKAGREIRPKSFEKYLGCTWSELKEEIGESCCTNLRCNKWIDAFAAVKARTDTVQLNRSELAGWVAAQLESMLDIRGNVAYRYKGAPICRTMWTRLHGVGEKTVRRALTGVKEGHTYFQDYGKRESPNEDLCWTLLHQKFFVEQENESVADGIFHLQDTLDFPQIFAYVSAEWGAQSRKLVLSGPVSPDGPSESLVRKVWRAEFGKVKPIRKGDFAKCGFCTELAAAHKAGFKTKAEADKWRTDNRIHNKIHREARRGCTRRAVEGSKDVQRVTSMTIDMTRPFHLPWCSRGSSDFRASEFDWEAYFQGSVNPSLKYWNRPLAWQYLAGSSESGYMPRVRVKTWGDAQKYWHGVNDSADCEDIRPYIKEPASDRPKKLANSLWVTDKIKKDVRYLAGKYCSREEQEWFDEVLDHSQLTRIIWDGFEGEGGLPGRPGHFAMKDKSGHEWLAHFRVLDDLPEDVWGVPPDRAEVQENVSKLTEEERLYVARTSFVNEGAAPVHPAWYGARHLNEEEKRHHDFDDESRFPAPHLRVTSILAENPTEEGLKKATVKELKSWLAEKGQRRSGSKPVLVQRVLSVFADDLEQVRRAEGGAQQQPAGGRRRAGGGRLRKRRRIGSPEPDEKQKASSSSSDDSPLLSASSINQRNRPHSASRVRVRRQFARVFACSDEEREAAAIREQNLRSDMSASSSEEWEPVNALRDLH